MLTASHKTAQLITIEIRHHRVGNHNVDSGAKQDLHGFETISRRNDLMAGALQHNLQVSPQGAVIFY
jgi:hypothetical protein